MLIKHTDFYTKAVAYFFLSELPSWSIFKIFWCCLLRRTVSIMTSRYLEKR